MEQVIFKQFVIPKKETRYDLLAKIAEATGLPIGKWLKDTAGWEHKDIDSVYNSAVSLSKDAGIPMSQALHWHFNEMKKL